MPRLVETSAMIVTCTKCGMPIGASAVYIGGRIYHHECSPYHMNQHQTVVRRAEMPLVADTIPERARELCRELEAMPSEGNIHLIEEALRWQAQLDARIVRGWLAQWEGLPIDNVPAGKYAADAVKDILDLILKDAAAIRTPIQNPTGKEWFSPDYEPAKPTSNVVPPNIGPGLPPRREDDEGGPTEVS